MLHINHIKVNTNYTFSGYLDLEDGYELQVHGKFSIERRNGKFIACIDSINLDDFNELGTHDVDYETAENTIIEQGNKDQWLEDLMYTTGSSNERI